MVSSANDDADLVRAAQAGDAQAFTALFERWFDRSYDVAWRIVRNRDTAAEVAQDTFLAAYTKLDTLRDADAFGGWVLRTARNKALNRLEREGRSSAMDTEDTVGIIDRGAAAADAADAVVRQEQIDLVWAASAALGERDASILDLHLRHDLDPGEIAEALDITPNAAHQTLFRLRRRLEGAIRSWVLWEEGSPACGALSEQLDSAGVESFGPAAVRAISSHVAECDTCDEKHAAVLSPASLFAAVPMVVVASGVREAAAAALADQGVPIDPEAVSQAEHPPETSVEPGPPGQGGAGIATKVLAGVGVTVLFVAGLVVGAMLLSDGDQSELVAQTATTDTTEASTSTEPPTTEAPATTDTTEPEPTGRTGTTTDTTAPPITGTTRTTALEPPETTGTTSTTTTSSTTTTTTTSTTAPVPEPRPSIVRFSVAHVGLGTCEGGRGDLYELRWTVEDAESVQLEGPNLEPLSGTPSEGAADACLPVSGSGTWTLTASGPGGESTESVSVP